MPETGYGPIPGVLCFDIWLLGRLLRFVQKGQTGILNVNEMKNACCS